MNSVSPAAMSSLTGVAVSEPKSVVSSPEKSIGNGCFDAPFADLVPVEEQGDGAALAEASTVVGELHPDLVLARRDRRVTVDLEQLQAEQVVAIGRLALLGVERPAAERAALRDVTPVAPSSGTSIWAVIACDLFFRTTTEFSVRRLMPPKRS